MHSLFHTIFLIAFLGIEAYAQKATYIDYHNYVNKAEYYLYNHQKIGQAKQLYLKAFSIVPEPLPKDCYMLARCYAIEGEYDSAWIFLKKSSNTTIVFNMPSEIIWQDTFYFEQFLKIRPEVLYELKELDSMHLSIYNKATEHIKQFVDSCSKVDQANRNWFNEANPQTREEAMANESVLKEQDDILQRKLLTYIRLHGYPGILACGTDIITHVLVHLSAENYESIKDLLFMELEQGKIMPYEIGICVDRNEYIDKNVCGLVPSSKRCSETDWDAIIKRRLKYGCSIYFSNNMRNIIGKKDGWPWVGNLVEK
ncbi:MAG: hypothetical protein U0Z17_03810 [Bacteroidales bacterium]